MFSFEQKNKQNYFLISALASENGSNQKSEGTLLYLTLLGLGLIKINDVSANFNNPRLSLILDN